MASLLSVAPLLALVVFLSVVHPLAVRTALVRKFRLALGLTGSFLEIPLPQQLARELRAQLRFRATRVRARLARPE